MTARRSRSIIVLANLLGCCALGEKPFDGLLKTILALSKSAWAERRLIPSTACRNLPPAVFIHACLTQVSGSRQASASACLQTLPEEYASDVPAVPAPMRRNACGSSLPYCRDALQ